MNNEVGMEAVIASESAFAVICRCLRFESKPLAMQVITYFLHPISAVLTYLTISVVYIGIGDFISCMLLQRRSDVQCAVRHEISRAQS
jgi:hypothetical protein